MGYTIFLNNRKNVTSDCDQDTANLHLEALNPRVWNKDLDLSKQIVKAIDM